MAAAEDRLWSFALAVYGAEGVSAECLEVQDRYGADVCLILTAAFVATLGLDVTRPMLSAWDEAVAPWRKGAVLPLRAVRTTLKPMEGDPDVKHVRSAVLAAELQAERLELRRLAGLIETTKLGAATESDAGRRIAKAIAIAGSLWTKEAVSMPRLVEAARLHASQPVDSAHGYDKLS